MVNVKRNCGYTNGRTDRRTKGQAKNYMPSINRCGSIKNKKKSHPIQLRRTNKSETYKMGLNHLFAKYINTVLLFNLKQRYF